MNTPNVRLVYMLLCNCTYTTASTEIVYQIKAEVSILEGKVPNEHREKIKIQYTKT